MSIPNYMLRRLFFPGGVRLLKATPEEKAQGICPTCSKPVFEKRFMGVMQLDGLYSHGNVYHYGCREVSGSWHKVGAVFTVPRGNLPQEEYRYWIGYAQQQSGYAMCRACRGSFYSDQQRELHFKDDKVFVGGQNCAVRLVAAYKILLTGQTCLICKRQRFNHTKWGVPICESDTCERAWKFESTRWIELERILLDQRKRDLLLKKVAANDALITRIDAPMREYCSKCKMYKDNTSHLALHNLWENGFCANDEPMA